MLARGAISVTVSTVADVAGQLDDEIAARPSASGAASPAIVTDAGSMPVAVRAAAAAMRAVALDLERRAHDRPLGIELEVERNLRHQPFGRAIILAADGGGRGDGILGVEHRPP